MVGTYIGYDIPKTLGKKETGASVTLPVFIDFMDHYLKNKPDIPFRIPPGIKLVRIDRFTGQYPGADTPESSIIYEAFKPNTGPSENMNSSIMNSPNNYDTDQLHQSDGSPPDTEGFY